MKIKRNSAISDTNNRSNKMCDRSPGDEQWDNVATEEVGLPRVVLVCAPVAGKYLCMVFSRMLTKYKACWSWSQWGPSPKTHSSVIFWTFAIYTNNLLTTNLKWRNINSLLLVLYNFDFYREYIKDIFYGLKVNLITVIFTSF